MKNRANKAPEPTPTSVTSPAGAGAAPAAVVAHPLTLGKIMKRRVVASICVGLVAASLALVFVWRSHQTPAEIARLSESLVTAKVHDYFRDPSEANLAAVRHVIANHRRVIERSDLPRESREALEWSLHEQIMIVHGIARNYDLKL